MQHVHIAIVISIHAPRTGSDGFPPLDEVKGFLVFQSTLPARGATCTAPGLPRGGTFQSTLPARGATTRKEFMSCSIAISIHAPRTGSDGNWVRKIKTIDDPFQSTLPARGATWQLRTHITTISYFNPRSPHGERRLRRRRVTCLRNFNPRSPHGERHPGGSRSRMR